MEILIAFISLAVGCVGTAATLLAVTRNRTKPWRKILHEIDQLSNWLNGEEFSPDIIVAFCNGGLLAADLLHIRRVQSKPVLSLILTWSVGPTGDREVKIDAPVEEDYFRNKKILLIDDVTNTGRLMQKVKNFLLVSMNVKKENLRTAVLGQRTHQRAFTPDYFGFEYGETIELPWGTVPR